MIASDALPRIDLGTLEAMWAFQTRTDRKYVVDTTLLPRVAESLECGTKILDIEGRTRFRYRTVYFDTPELRSYRDAAHGRPRRFKVRTRTYLDSGLHRLEVKSKDGRGRTSKHRIRKTGDPFDLTSREREFVDGQLNHLPPMSQLGATLVTSYQRTTLALPHFGGRVTVDTGLTFSMPGERGWCADHIAIIETKAGEKATWVDRWLWRQHIRPTKVSKYGTSLAVIDPELPANRWRPVISEHFQDLRPQCIAEQALAPPAAEG